MSEVSTQAAQENTTTPVRSLESRTYWSKHFLKDTLFALSLGNLCFISAWFPLLYDADQGYFNKLRINVPTLLALASNILIFSAVSWLSLFLLRRFPSRPFRFAVHFLLFASLFAPFEFLRIRVLEIPDFVVVGFLRKPVGIGIIIAFLLLLAWQHKWIARGLSLALALFSPLALFNLLKVFLVCTGVLHLKEPTSVPPLAAPFPSSPSRPRLIWIVFDEFDYRLVFDTPLPGLVTPNFDALRKNALFTTNAFPPGECTIKSIPALTTGYPVIDSTITSPSDLRLTLENGTTVASWSSHSIFSEAQSLGLNIAVVGWYHPYDRLFASNVQYCAWSPIQSCDFGTTRFGTAFKRELAALTLTLYGRYMYGELCRETTSEALDALAAARYDFAFLHLPPPHRPGVYNPETDSYTIIPVRKSLAYRNNVILADRVLGKIRTVLERTGQWQNSWLIVSTDHFWREATVHDGKRDFRIPFIVKAPGKNKPITFSSSFSTVASHDLALAILKGDLKDQSSLTAWLDANVKNYPAPDPKYYHATSSSSSSIFSVE